jgi:hypothetical protein
VSTPSSSDFFVLVGTGSLEGVTASLGLRHREARAARAVFNSMEDKDMAEKKVLLITGASRGMGVD